MGLDQKRLKMLRNKTKLSQKETAAALGVPHGTYRNWEQGVRTPDTETVMKIAEYFNVSTDFIFGRNSPTATTYPNEQDKTALESDDNSVYWPNGDRYLPTNIMNLTLEKTHEIEKVNSGQIIFSAGKNQHYFNFGLKNRASFCLKFVGDSMRNARILDGDYVFIHEQETVNDGEIAAVLIGEEITLKRVYRSKNELVLMSENPNYKPVILRDEEINSVRILGKAVAIQSSIN